MTQKIESYFKKASKVYAKKCVKGLFGSTKTKARNALLPSIYKNRYLRRMHHPKLETAFLELTNNCNLRCKMCNWQSRGENGYISRLLFESCIDQFAEIKLGVLNLQFGGESLLHPNFKDFLRYAISKRDQGGIGSVGITDNGMLFDQSIADLFVSLKVDWVNFSLDGLGEVNDSIRLGSKYTVIEKNIKYLIEKRGSAKKPIILLNMVDTGKTEAQKMEFYREWVQLVDGIELIPCILPNNAWNGKKTLVSDIELSSPSAFCHYPMDTIIICWNGKAIGCCFDTKIDMVLGDANKETIRQIWDGSKFQQLRKEVLTKKFPINSPCYNCEFWKVNFKPKDKLILDGKARAEYDGTIIKIRKTSQNA